MKILTRSWFVPIAVASFTWALLSDAATEADHAVLPAIAIVIYDCEVPKAIVFSSPVGVRIVTAERMDKDGLDINAGIASLKSNKHIISEVMQVEISPGCRTA